MLRASYSMTFRGMALVIKPVIQTAWKHMYALLFISPEVHRALDVKIYADGWGLRAWGGAPVDRQRYFQLATTLLDPLLDAHTLAHGTHYMLEIPRRLDGRVVLPPFVDELFAHFVKTARLPLLGPYDWDRFFLFVDACNHQRMRVTPDDIERLLVDASFPEPLADLLTHLYAICSVQSVKTSL